MEESVATRLKLFIDTNDLSSTQFADMCGIPRPTLSQILSGRNKKISDILVGQIHKAFPDLSVVWLLFGEGPVKVGINKNLGSTSESISQRDDDSGKVFSGDGQPSGSYAVPDGNVQPNFSNISSERRSQNLEMCPDNREGDGNSNLRALKPGENIGNVRSNQVFESDLRILDLQRQIDQMRQNPRKVLQITIYYDDSTFETFIPKS